MKLDPVFTTKPVPSGNCHCPMGYAPGSNADRGCMYCDHPVRGTCHVDWGKDCWGHRIVDRSYRPGERLPIRYANQTSVYVGGWWADLRAIADELTEVAASLRREDLRDDRLACRIEQVVRTLPDGYQRAEEVS